MTYLTNPVIPYNVLRPHNGYNQKKGLLYTHLYNYCTRNTIKKPSKQRIKWAFMMINAIRNNGESAI